MFEFGREIRRRLTGGVPQIRDGLTGGDASLLELLDLSVLTSEAKSADIAAGRVSCRDPAAALLSAARVWRELARRGGDPIALRKSAALSASAYSGFASQKRRPQAALARLEQARCAMLGAELFGDEGLEAAAQVALREAFAAGGVAAALAGAELAALDARRALSAADPQLALAKARAAQALAPALRAASRGEPALRLAALDFTIGCAERLVLVGARLKDADIIGPASRDLAKLAETLDPAYEPLTAARANMAHGAALSLLGETVGDAALLERGAQCLAEAAQALSVDQSPIDYAKAHSALGVALQALAEATTHEPLETAITAYDRAARAVRDLAVPILRGHIAHQRGVAMARLAEMTGDLAVLDIAEAAFRIELAQIKPGLDPVRWALTQVNLAGIYEIRLALTGRDRGERGRANLALNAALDVFAEAGLRSLTLIAQDGIKRLKAVPAL